MFVMTKNSHSGQLTSFDMANADNKGDQRVEMKILHSTSGIFMDLTFKLLQHQNFKL